MNTSATIEGLGHVPSEPMVVIPNRVDITILHSLEEILGGSRKITWLVEESLRPSAEILAHMQSKQAHGMLFRVDYASRENRQAKIRAELAAGRHVALLPGKPTQPAAYPADVPMETLHYLLDDYTEPVLPVYAGMYNSPKQPPLVTSHAPCAKLLLRLLPKLPAGPGLAERTLAAWLEAAAAQVSQLVDSAAETLPQALLRSLLAHAHSSIIDGVDDSRMSYRHLLYLAAPLARHLRKHTASKRLGIILPPGKLSIIANVACIFAGISPVNIDYSYDKAALQQVISRAELTRFITEHCFIDMQQSFPWPRQRDILFIDEALAPSGFRILSRLNLLSRWVTPGRIAKWIRMPEAEPREEALAVFTTADEGPAVRGASWSHRAVLAGAALCQSRYGMGAGQCVLSALSFHHRAGLLAGLIHPLLAGQDIVTYPLPRAGKRLCHLARQYKPTMAVFTPEQARDTLSHAQEGDFDSTAYLQVVGKVPEALAQQAYEQRRLFLCECYFPLEAAMPTACNMAPIAPAENSPARAITTGGPGAAGILLPGMALRVTDMDRPDTPQPVSQPGLLWVKGAGLSTGSMGQEKAGAADRWVRTGDVGCLRADGLLSVGGPRHRFSKVNGEILSHEKLERLMAKFLRAEEEPGRPMVAVVGLPDPASGEEQIILLSAVHKVVGPHDVITLRYDLTNAHYPSHWAPGRIVALRAIPTLPGGRINYPLCQALARKALGIDAAS